MTRLKASPTARVANGSSRVSRVPITTWRLSAVAFRNMPRIKDAGSCPSAEQMAAYSPRACERPARMAGTCPKLRVSLTIFTQGWSAARRLRISREASGEPSSTKSISYSPGVRSPARALSNSVRTASSDPAL
jgi:hypothetical protein